MIDEAAIRFGKKLRDIRWELNLRQSDVAERARLLAEGENCHEFSFTKARLSRIENGKTRAGVPKILALATIYQLEVETLLRFWSGNDQ